MGYPRKSRQPSTVDFWQSGDRCYWWRRVRAQEVPRKAFGTVVEVEESGIHAKIREDGTEHPVPLVVVETRRMHR